MHEREKWKWSRSVVSDSSRPHGLQPTRLHHPWDFPGKSTGVGCHCLLQYYPSGTVKWTEWLLQALSEGLFDVLQWVKREALKSGWTGGRVTYSRPSQVALCCAVHPCWPEGPVKHLGYQHHLVGKWALLPQNFCIITTSLWTTYRESMGEGGPLDWCPNCNISSAAIP